MRKKSKVLIILLAAALAITAVSFKAAERIIVRRVASASGNNVTIGSLSVLLPPALKIKKLNISYNLFPHLSFREINIRRAIIGNAFAFSGPGDIVISNKQREISVKGSISGNFKQGTLTIKPTSIKIDQLGTFQVKGMLEQWGKEGVNATIELGGTEIKEINELFDLKIPFNGKAVGTVLLNFAGEETKNIQFDVVINNLSTEEKGGSFTAFVKGFYDIIQGKTTINDGKLSNKAGGHILFKGVIDKENFNLNFETEKMVLEEFLKLIPEETRIKYNLSVSGGSAFMKDFNLEKVKKKSISAEIFLLPQTKYLS
ncbi:MAG: hypothetical protein JW957_00050 [Candidatus Omnitrophica bacterium]|nr:hypothetical protein [Candidatus Omnitrophota bacterium]